MDECCKGDGKVIGVVEEGSFRRREEETEARYVFSIMMIHQ